MPNLSQSRVLRLPGRGFSQAVILACSLTGPLCCLSHATPQAPDLDSVLGRTQAYVAAYEQELGLIVGREEYVQNATWLGQTRPRGVIAREQRRLSSDFLLLSAGARWYGVRNVLRVNGVPVDEPETFPESVEALIATSRDTRYDIGEFQRTFNVPTFPLTFFRPGNLFRFNDSGDSQIDLGELIEANHLGNRF